MPISPPRFGSRPSVRKSAAWSHNGKTTTQRGYGWQHQKDREQLLRDEPLCRECAKHGQVAEATIADHIKPLAEGGARHRSNLQPLCKPCSDAKTKREASRGRGGYQRL